MSSELVMLLQARSDGCIDESTFAEALTDLRRRYAA
jgi:hypothetical protein